MYQLSRSMYRELAPEILEDHVAAAAGSNHERVLRACEAAVYRLATDRHYFAKPSKTLFREIRVYFPMTAQHRVFRVVDRYMTFARQWLEAQPSHGYDVAGNRLECRATTRKARPASACRCRSTATARRTSTWRTATSSSRRLPTRRARASLPD